MLTYYQQNSMSSCQQLTGPSLSFCPLRTTAESLNLSHLKNLHALRLFALIFLGKITQPLHLIFPEDKKRASGGNAHQVKDGIFNWIADGMAKTKRQEFCYWFSCRLLRDGGHQHSTCNIGTELPCL